MRKNTEECLLAFVSGQTYKGDRDLIVHDPGDKYTAWYLHGNRIAETNGIILTLSTAGWNTATTWDRLNALAVHYGVKFTREAKMFDRHHLQTASFDVSGKGWGSY